MYATPEKRELQSDAQRRFDGERSARFWARVEYAWAAIVIVTCAVLWGGMLVGAALSLRGAP